MNGGNAKVYTNCYVNIEKDRISFANDAVMKDEIRKASIKLAKPQGVKLVIKNIEESQERNRKHFF